MIARKCDVTTLALLFVVVTVSVEAGDFLTYSDQTSTRLVAAPALSTADIEEKDYAWGDVDLDGDVDMVCVRKEPFDTPGRRRNVLFMNEGLAEGHALNGVLVDRTSMYATDADDGGLGFLDLTNDRDVALVDANGDGWLDIVTATTYGAGLPKTISHPRVYRNKGSTGGLWQGFRYEVARTPTMPIAPHFCGLGYGDVTNDGAPDLYFVDYLNTLEDRLWINDGNGYFNDESTARMTTEMLESAFGVHAVIADMNNDGVRDIVKDRALVAPIRVSLSYNDPTAPGTFNAFETVYLGSSYHVEVGDLNNDGRLDIIIDDDGIDRYLLNQGNGADGRANFQQHVFPPASDSFGGNIRVADLDRDSFNDVLIADVDVDCCGCNRHMHIWRNQGDLPNVTFQEEPAGIPVAARTGTQDIAVFDLNGDGWLDLVLGTCTSMSIWIANPPLDVQFSFPDGLPSAVTPLAEHELLVQIDALGGGTLLAGASLLHVSIDDGPVTTSTLADLGGGLFRATLPGAPCSSRIAYSFSAVLEGGLSFANPPTPGEVYETTAAGAVADILFEDGEPPISWSVENHPGLTGGSWQSAEPETTTWDGSPVAPGDDADATAGGRAFVTANGAAGDLPTAHDVDGGPTRLVSPVFDLSNADAVISYDFWFATFLGEPDLLVVEISADGGANYLPVAEHAGTGGSWVRHTFVASAHASPTASMRLRFSTADFPNDSISEAGVDNIRVTRVGCASFARGDCNDDGAHNVADPVTLLTALFGGSVVPGCADACDANDDGDLDIADVIWLLTSLFGAGPAPSSPYPGCGEDPTTSTDALLCTSYASCS
ncbi:MAG: FG-GAP-like repeat-containing protein [Planctomycetota bacterium]